MNTEVNSGGGRAQKVLDRMKNEKIAGDIVAKAKWYLDQQTAFYKDIVTSDASQSVFLQGWLNRSKDMQEVISGAKSLSLYGAEEGVQTWTAKALLP